MEKSAIALRMSNGTGQFIRDYMFPKSRENTVAVISEQLGAYREIRERVEDLEKRIGMLDVVHAADLELTGVRAINCIRKLFSDTSTLRVAEQSLPPAAMIWNGRKKHRYGRSRDRPVFRKN